VNPKFQKIIYLLIFLFAFAEKGNGQILSDANLDLNTGGVIYDVADDVFHNCYIVVGNFTSIGTTTGLHNIAFLNKSDLTVNANTFLYGITNIDGEIRTVDMYSEFLFPQMVNRIFIGGNFTSITTTSGTYARNGFAELISNYHYTFFSNSILNVSSWNILMDIAGFETGVNDIFRSNDTLILVGNFQFLSSGQPYNLLYNVISFKATNTHAWIPIFNNSGGSGSYEYDCYTCQVFSIERFGSFYYLGGNDGGGGNGFLRKYNLSGNYISTFLPPLCASAGGVWRSVPIVSGADQFIVSTSKYGGATGTYVHNLSGNLIDGPFCEVTNIFPNAEGLANYKKTIITRTQNQINFYKMNGIYPAVSSLAVTLNTTTFNTNSGGLATSDVYGGLGYRRVHVVENYLFVTGNSLTTVSGVGKAGLAAYCMEPLDAKFFILSDSTICPDQTVTYHIPQVPYADGYKWEYTGNGADLQIDNDVDLAPIEISNINANTIDVYFTSAFTPGQLKVTPYSLCNITTKIYSNTITTNIISNPLPHINAGPDTAFTCYNDTLVLSGYSDSAVVSYEWLDPIPPNFQGTDTTIFQPGNYVFKVTNALGCSNFDTVTVSIDTIAPIATPPIPPYELTCAIPFKDFPGSSPTPNTTYAWYQGATFFPNPISISTEGGYYFRVTDTLNGCIKDVGIYVELDIAQPNITILGYPGFNITQPIDTLTCYENVLNLTCSSDTINTTAIWTDVDTLTNLGDNINITTGGNYFILVTDNSNGCTNFMGVNIAVFQNLPDAFVPPNSFLNCSQDSLVLDGSSSLSNVNLDWNGGTISGPDPVTIYDAGIYYLTVTDTLNGCSVIDSVEIAQNNSITVFAGNDTLLCDQDFVNLTVNYSGTITGINYLWNSGSTLTNEIYSAGTSTYASVEVFGDNSCYGVDTVYLNLPPTPVINFDGFKPCGNDPSGQIVATPVSGTEPFQYSIDAGLNYQTSPVFNGLNFGIFPIWVKDSLLCDYEFEAIIDENSSLQQPEFLFSTYNFENDTVVIIDVSNPPTDSTAWEFSSEIIVLDNNALSPTILLPDTGVFLITMNAYYGECLVQVSKTIYSSAFDSLAATNYNQNGIKSIELFPNPTSGTFTVTVEFYKSQRAAMVVQDMVGYTYVYNEYDESIIISQDITLDSSVQDGTYILKIVSEFDSSTITFILAQ